MPSRNFSQWIYVFFTQSIHVYIYIYINVCKKLLAQRWYAICDGCHDIVFQYHFGIVSSNLLLDAVGKTFRISRVDSTFIFKFACEEERFSLSFCSLFISWFVCIGFYIKYRFLFCFFLYHFALNAYIKLWFQCEYKRRENSNHLMKFGFHIKLCTCIAELYVLRALQIS